MLINFSDKQIFENLCFLFFHISKFFYALKKHTLLFFYKFEVKNGIKLNVVRTVS